MKKTLLTLAIVSVAAWSATSSGDPKKPIEKPKSPLFEKFATLVGDWEGKDPHPGSDQTTKVNYKLTSGGSVLVETIDPGGDHEMITVIHPDGDSLVLTHYCMLGNQPQMTAKGGPSDDKVAFQFVKCTNLKSDKEMHMHSVTYTFVDKDTLKSDWTNYDNGKESGCANFELKRKK